MKALNKKGNVAGLQTFIMSIVGVAIVLAIAFMILAEMQTATYSCPTANPNYNATGNLCWNADYNVSVAEQSGASSNLGNIMTKLGNVPSWIGIIIVVVLASLVLGYFYARR